MRSSRDSERFPASAGPWLDVYFENERAAARFATGVRKVLGYRATVDEANPHMVTTNVERWQISELMQKQKVRAQNAPLRVRIHGEQSDQKRTRLTRSQEAYVHRKIRILRREHPRWSQKQVVAVAISYARRRGR